MKVSKYSKWLRLIAYISIVATTVYLPPNFGWTQPMEMFFYDNLIRLRPTEPVDEKIVIVGLTEEDVKNLAELPIADRTLAELINKIKKHHPRVIGMDLHRNVPTGSGYSKLKSIIRSTPNLIGIEKTNQGDFDFPAVPPNPDIKKNGMSSASDFIVDSGDVVRRGYLYVSESSLSSKQIPSFGLKVALEYLKKESISSTSSGGQEHHLKLGNAVFPRLKYNQELYQQDDIDNYQIIINFRSSKNPFKTISFSDVLNNNIDSSLIEDKIVLLGASASTLGDDFFTPNSRKASNSKQEIFGVEIHAHQASQIINAVLNHRKIIKLLPSALENSWVLFWIVAPSIILIEKVNLNSKLSNFWFNYTSINLSALVAIVSIGYLSLTAGYWMPVAHPTIALLSSFILGYSYIEIIKEKQQALLFLKKFNKATKELKETQKKLVAKEKLEAYEKLSIKMAHEIRNHLNAVNLANDNCQYKLEEFKRFLSENSFLFEDISDDNNSPNLIADYFDNKFGRIEQSISKISLIIESILTENILTVEQVCLTDVNKLISKIVNDRYWIRDSLNETISPTISLNCASDLPQIKISSIELERILVNLLTNACDSLYQKTLLNLEYIPTITVATSYHSLAIEIKVRDNGMGISIDDIDKVFIPFWTTKNSVDGVGVGLFFSRQRIEKYNGIIKVRSTEGQWAEFIISLPTNNFD
jgi:adenylate cyclase